ncbi:MAG: hypothetical protein JKY48_08575 [Flavobacteriales bacterium]|nr:hypothetical protein [Flavobacteriales bacterium]
MTKLKGIVLTALIFLTGAAQAELTGDFSRANCVTNNESITFRPFDPFYRVVISWHTLNGVTHYAGDEDPLYCSSSSCPTSPSALEDARCEASDNCLWPYSFHTVTGRWAAIHSIYGLDSESTTDWTVEGRHGILYGFYYGIPIYTVNRSLPTTDCNL